MTQHSAAHDFVPHTATKIRSRRRSTMQGTGVFLFLYVVAVVLFSSWPHLYMIANVLGFVLALVFAVELFAFKLQLCFPVPLVCFALFLCYGFFHMIFLPGYFAELVTLSQLYILTFIVVNYVVNCDDYLAVELAVYTGVVLSFMYTLLFQTYDFGDRIGSTVGNQNEYAYVLMCGILLVVRRLVVDYFSGTLSIFRLAACGLYFSMSMYGVLYWAGSRAGTAVTLSAVGLMAVYWVFCQPMPQRIWSAVGVLALFIALGVAVSMSSQSSRFINLAAYLGGHTVDEGSVGIRDHMLRDGVRLWLERPFTGWGIGRYGDISGWRTYAHNNYIELLTGTGVIGLLLYLMVPLSTFVSLVRGWLRSPRAVAKIDTFWAMSLLLAFAAADMATVTYYRKFFWLMMALAIAVAARHRGAVLRRSPLDPPSVG